MVSHQVLVELAPGILLALRFLAEDRGLLCSGV